MSRILWPARFQQKIKSDDNFKRCFWFAGTIEEIGTLGICKTRSWKTQSFSFYFQRNRFSHFCCWQREPKSLFMKFWKPKNLKRCIRRVVLWHRSTFRCKNQSNSENERRRWWWRNPSIDSKARKDTSKGSEVQAEGLLTIECWPYYMVHMIWLGTVP